MRSVLKEVWQEGVYMPLQQVAGDQGDGAVWQVRDNMTPPWDADPLVVLLRMGQATIDGDWDGVPLSVRF